MNVMERIEQEDKVYYRITISRADYILLFTTALFMLLIFTSALYMQTTEHFPEIQNVMTNAIY
jgi:hypothetical protein